MHVTYSDLFAFVNMLIDLIGLVIYIVNKHRRK